MASQSAYKSIVERDADGLFIKLPDDWRFEPEEADVIISKDVQRGGWLVEPDVDENGQPTCRFNLPDSNPL